jgi:putative ATP-binding cassette transporter
MKIILTLPRDAWRLARPYFTSNERWSARGLLAAIILLNLTAVGLDVILSYWGRAFFNTLQTKDFEGFLALLLTWHKVPTIYLWGFIPTAVLPGFVSIATIYIAVVVANRYLNQWLQIRWRQWMTHTMLAEWLADRAYYRINLGSGAGGTDANDNPDQRIAEDLRDYVEATLSTSIDFMSNIVSLISFLLILWGLSGPLDVLGVTVPAYLVWVALLYAALGTALTHLIGRPLVALRFRQQRVEANFRFSLVRLRENMEAIALSGGEGQERRGLISRFADVRSNWWDIMQRAKLLNIFINGYSQISTVFPYIVTAPRYFKGTLDLGGLTQTVGAFSSVQGSMSWFVTAYAGLANLRAVIDRLLTFQAAIAAARAEGRDGLRVAPAASANFTLENATLRLPDGRVIMENAALTFTPGVSTAITGRTGSGKSTLFRALAGIWPFASGTVTPGSGRALFLPQRPYFPLGTLREALSYPDEASRFSDAELATALADVGLAALVPRLDTQDSWGQILSGGEQQRLALARALLIRPDWLFLDEATASLDPATEQAVLAVLRQRLPNTTLISITHRADVAALHDAQLRFDQLDSGVVTLRPAAA